MDKFEFTRRDTTIVKFVGVILMFLHHLFAFPDRIREPSSYISLLSIKGTTIEYLSGRFGHLCVGIFLFLSGFGIYKQYINQNEKINFIIIDKIKKLYINYWVIFFIFIPISFVVGYRVFDFKEFFRNLLCYSSSYVGEWWFLKVYIESMLLFPAIIKFIENKNITITILKLIIFTVFARTIFPNIVKLNIFETFITTSFYGELQWILAWIPCFISGCIFAKFDLFVKLKLFVHNNKVNDIIQYIFLLLFVIYMKYSVDFVEYYDYIFAPLFIISSVEILKNMKIDKVFEYFGKYSMNMWLVHSLLCYQYIQAAVYFPKVSILILLWLLFLSFILAYVILRIQKKVLS